MTRTKRSKNTKLCASQSGRSSPPPEGLREFEGSALNRGTAKKRYSLSFWANNVTDSKRSKPSTIISGQFAEIRAWTKLSSALFICAGSELPAWYLPNSGAFSAGVALSTAI
ncbi:MAG: hypothetical protein E7493_05260 [Ruminococcus albus]|nr:hypothetical protein [Ruminococcus albus]